MEETTLTYLATKVTEEEAIARARARAMAEEEEARTRVMSENMNVLSSRINLEVVERDAEITKALYNPNISSTYASPTIELADTKPSRRVTHHHTLSNEAIELAPLSRKTSNPTNEPTSPKSKNRWFGVSAANNSTDNPMSPVKRYGAGKGSIRQRMMSAAEIQDTLLNRSSTVDANIATGYGSSSSTSSGSHENDERPHTTLIIDNNGWDDGANRTLVNWYHTFEELSYSYQYILDRNFSISTTLSMISIVSSSALGIFSGFKLWIQNDEAFKSSSDAIMLVSNFVVAAITTMSKRYIDDARNEKIKAYVTELDSFLGLICSQLTITPEYRMPAKKFYESYMKDYTKLMITMPNMSIKEMLKAKKQYNLYKRAKRDKNESEA